MSKKSSCCSPNVYVLKNPVRFADLDRRCPNRPEGDVCSDAPGGANNPIDIEEVVVRPKPKSNVIAADPFPIGGYLGSNWGLGGSSGSSGSGPGGSSGSSGGGLGGGFYVGSGYRTPEINIVPQPQVTPTMSDFDWDQLIELLTNPATDGIINGSSALVARGLKNWDAQSAIVKTKVIAETISTKTPFSAQALENASPYFKWGGRVVGAVGIANSLTDAYNGKISKSRTGLDTAMGIVGFIGPIGAGVSLTYFGGIFLYEHFSGNKFLSNDEYY